MRHTPRSWTGSSRTPSSRAPRGIGTLIGNGWLRESPRNLIPREWDLRGRSAMRKCMFMPVPPQLRELAPHVAGVLPAPPRRPEAPVVPHRRDPQKDVRMLPAVDPRAFAKRPAAAPAQAPTAAWWEDPIALGSLLILAPPIGLAAVWSSKRYSNDARWALTVMTALTMCLVTAIAVVVVVSR